jgi:hypothetical protein
MESRRRTVPTLRALLRPVLGSMALSLIGLGITRRLAPFEVLRASNDVVGNYLQTVGSIYAVLLAFVTFVVWNQFNDARGFVEEESNELLDLYRTTRGLPQPVRSQLQGLTRAYAQAVLEAEWDLMASSRPAGAGPGAAILDQMWESAHAVNPQMEPDRSVYREVLKRLDDLSDVRSNRMSSSRTKIPTALRILIYSGAVTVTGSMYLFAVDSFAVHAIITAALAGAVSHVVYVIEDLDNCFDGGWQVPRTPFERVAEQMRVAAAADQAA